MNKAYTHIDTHAHVNLHAFKDDWMAVMDSCAEVGVGVVNVGTQRDTSKKAVEIAQRCENGYACVGLHPIHTSASYHDEKELGDNMKAFTARGEKFDTAYYRELAQSSDKVLAIGECGYDYYRLEKNTRELQEEAFIAQIELANELDLPLMIHTRDAKGNQESVQAEAGVGNVYDDTYETLKRYAKVPFNVHFFAGTYEQAKKFFDIGGTISFTGVITFAAEYEEVVRNAPLDMIHAETDCPYVAPVPYRGKRCQPQMVSEVYKKIAGIKNMDAEEVRQQLLQNFQRMYFSKR